MTCKFFKSTCNYLKITGKTLVAICCFYNNMGGLPDKTHFYRFYYKTWTNIGLNMLGLDLLFLQNFDLVNISIIII